MLAGKLGTLLLGGDVTRLCLMQSEEGLHSLSSHYKQEYN